jgi:hypothetical protein
MAQQKGEELSAFCATCPLPEDVSTVLGSLGFLLAFTMPAEEHGTYMHLPPLPAQFHYDGPCGTEVIYLAGRDTPLEGEVFPFHASRFWLYTGADAQAFQLTMSTLAFRYQFTWRVPCEDAAHEQEEVA